MFKLLLLTVAVAVAIIIFLEYTPAFNALVAFAAFVLLVFAFLLILLARAIRMRIASRTALSRNAAKVSKDADTGIRPLLWKI